MEIELVHSFPSSFSWQVAYNKAIYDLHLLLSAFKIYLWALKSSSRRKNNMLQTLLEIYFHHSHFFHDVLF